MFKRECAAGWYECLVSGEELASCFHVNRNTLTRPLGLEVVVALGLEAESRLQRVFLVLLAED